MLVDGEVVEEGSHQELLDKDSMYALLVREQRGGRGASANDEYKVSELGAPKWSERSGEVVSRQGSQMT